MRLSLYPLTAIIISLELTYILLEGVGVMQNIKHVIVNWDGELESLPEMPFCHFCQNSVFEFKEQMAEFLKSWKPEPPAGGGWSLVDKRWGCTKLAKDCLAIPNHKTGCLCSSRIPQSVWECSIYNTTNKHHK